jgi:predicted DNA binding protein
LLAVGFSIYHHGCPASQSTERFPGVSMRILSSHPYGANMASVLQYASARRGEDLRGFLDYWRAHSAVTNMSVVDRAPGGAMFKVGLKSNIGWVTKAVLDSNGFFLTSIPVAGGMEAWSVFIEEENKTALFSQLDKVGTVKVNQISRLELDRDGGPTSLAPLSNLTPKQSEVLKGALEFGYFDSPRRVDSRELAKRLGIAQSTLLEHLRKAQTKILRQVLAPQWD